MAETPSRFVDSSNRCYCLYHARLPLNKSIGFDLSAKLSKYYTNMSNPQQPGSLHHQHQDWHL